jgi:dodecin
VLIGAQNGVSRRQTKEVAMADSVYRVTEVVGVSSESWEAAARTAVETAAKSVRELRVAEVVRQDLTIQEGGCCTTASGSASRSSTTPNSRAAAGALERLSEGLNSGGPAYELGQ